MTSTASKKPKLNEAKIKMNSSYSGSDGSWKELEGEFEKDKNTESGHPRNPGMTMEEYYYQNDYPNLKRPVLAPEDDEEEKSPSQCVQALTRKRLENKKNKK